MLKLVKQNFLKNKKLYKSVVQELVKKINKNVPINHVGSTAIPNMYGKNIIDVLIGAKDDNEFQELKTIIVDAGYFAGNTKDKIYQFFSSTGKETSSGDVHIHLVILNTERYREFIVLREYLLNNKNEALAYSNHKKELIKKNITNRGEYRKVKSEYVTKLLERAKKSFNK